MSACKREAGVPSLLLHHASTSSSSTNVLWPGGPRLGWAYPVPESLRAQAFLYSVVCLYSLLHVVFSPVARKRVVSLTATAVHACGCLAYLVMGNAWLPFLYTQDARPVLVVRSLEWAISVPLFLRMLAQLIEPRHKQLRKYEALQSLAILLGCLLGPFFVASPVRQVNTCVAWGCFGAACAVQVAVLKRYHYFFSKMRGSMGFGRDRTLLGVAHVAIFALFALYPLVWYAGVLSQLISPETETLAFAWMDLVSKFIFTTILCNLTSRYVMHEGLVWVGWVDGCLSSTQFTHQTTKTHPTHPPFHQLVRPQSRGLGGPVLEVCAGDRPAFVCAEQGRPGGVLEPPHGPADPNRLLGRPLPAH